MRFAQILLCSRTRFDFSSFPLTHPVSLRQQRSEGRLGDSQNRHPPRKSPVDNAQGALRPDAQMPRVSSAVNFLQFSRAFCRGKRSSRARQYIALLQNLFLSLSFSAVTQKGCKK